MERILYCYKVEFRFVGKTKCDTMFIVAGSVTEGLGKLDEHLSLNDIGYFVDKVELVGEGLYAS